MKIYLDIGIHDSLKQVVEQVLITVGGFEMASSAQEADGFVVSEQGTTEKYLTETDKPVAQVLWWNQRPSQTAQSDRFKICPGFENGKIIPGFGFTEAMAFLNRK